MLVEKKESKEIKQSNAYDIIEEVLATGNLVNLNSEQRVIILKNLCESLGLNYRTRPFEFITMNGKLVLYARKDCTDQLRNLHKVSIDITDRTNANDVFMVTAKATYPDGRTDTSIGAVSIGGLRGDALANAFMKAECVPLEYEILTKNGFQHPLELEKGQLVASVDPKTYEIQWTPLQDISIYEDQKVSLYANSAVEFEITDGHKWIVESANKVNKGLIPFEEIVTGNYLILAGKSNPNEESILSPKEAAALGWIVTDGTIKKYKNEFYRASVCQSKTENFEHIEWAFSDLGKVTKGITDNRDRGWKDQNWWHLSTIQTKTLFHKAGYRKVADLPSIVTKLGFSARAAMLEAMMRADGDKRNNFGKTKKEIIESFQILCALNGFLTSKTTTRVMTKSTKPLFVTRKISYNKIAIQNLEKISDRKATVWCPTTFHGTWICRTSEGQVLVTGNTKAKRRVTLSICGLGLLDESEVSDIPEVKNRALDQVSSGAKPIDAKHTPLYGKPTDKQLKRLFAITKASNWDPEAVTSLMSEKYDKISSKDLNIDEYNELCKIIEENPIKPMEEADPFPFETEGK